MTISLNILFFGFASSLVEIISIFSRKAFLKFLEQRKNIKEQIEKRKKEAQKTQKIQEVVVKEQEIPKNNTMKTSLDTKINSLFKKADALLAR